MKNVCSNCGELFDGVVCTNCGKTQSKSTVITVSKPVSEEETAPAAVSDKTLKALEKNRKKAQDAAERVRRLEEKEQKRAGSAEKRERRLVQSEQSNGKLPKLITQFRHVLSLSITGATRQAIHFVISPRGNLAFVLLIPLCALIPLIISISCTVYAGIDTSPRFFEAVGEVFFAAGSDILTGFLFWLELSVAAVLYIRAHSFAINSAMTIGRAVGLVLVSQLPALFLTPLFAVCLFIVPALSLLLAVLAAFQFIIMLFVGVEFAAMDKKRGVFTSFSVMLAAYICTVAVIAAVNFPTASDYILNLISKVYI